LAKFNRWHALQCKKKGITMRSRMSSAISTFHPHGTHPEPQINLDTAPSMAEPCQMLTLSWSEEYISMCCSDCIMSVSNWTWSSSSYVSKNKNP
jgi:hypothetical protein